MLQNDFVERALMIGGGEDVLSGGGVVVGHKVAVDGLAHLGHGGVDVAVGGGNATHGLTDVLQGLDQHKRLLGIQGFSGGS